MKKHLLTRLIFLVIIIASLTGCATESLFLEREPYHYNIIMARLEGDDGTCRKRVASELDSLDGTYIMYLGRTIPAEPAGKDKIVGHELARKYIKDSGADALVWGSVETVDERRVVKLHYTANDEDLKDWQMLTLVPLKAEQDLLPELPEDGAAQVAGIIALSYLTFLEPSTIRLFSWQMDRRISDMRKMLWAEEDAKTRARLGLVLGDACTILGLRLEWDAGKDKSGEEMFTTAAGLYRIAAKESGAGVSEECAAARISLALTLSCEADEHWDAEKYRQALAEYDRALEIVSPANGRELWHSAMLGKVRCLYYIGAIEDDMTTLKLSRQKLLEVSDNFKIDEDDEYKIKEAKKKLKVLIDKNYLAHITCELGEMENGTEKLREAADSYRKGLEEFSYPVYPYLWASLSRSLGNALYETGYREDDPAALSEALERFDDASGAFEKKGRELDKWVYAMIGKASSLRALAVVNKDRTLLQKALNVLGQAEGKVNKKNNPLPWASLKSEQAYVLLILGDGKDRKLHAESVSAAEQALSACSKKKHPRDWARHNANLGEACLMLGIVEKDRARIEKSVALFKESIKIFDEKGDAYNRERVNNLLKRALLLLEEKTKLAGAGELPSLRSETMSL